MSTKKISVNENLLKSSCKVTLTFRNDVTMCVTNLPKLEIMGNNTGFLKKKGKYKA